MSQSPGLFPGPGTVLDPEVLRARLVRLGLLADDGLGRSSRTTTVRELSQTGRSTGDESTLSHDEIAERQARSRELELAVRAFQQTRGLLADGVVDDETAAALEHAHWQLGDRALSLREGQLLVGDDVAELQGRLQSLGFLTARTDGIFGPQTESALRRFQTSVGLVSNGIAGPQTLAAFSQLKRSVGGGTPAALRERESWRRAGRHLGGLVVVLDPGHGGSDRGAVSATGLTESQVTYDLASRVEDRLMLHGAVVHLTRGAGQSGGSEADRADFANEREADVLISLHCDHSRSSSAQGAATFFYGHQHFGAWSPIGEQLAGIIQREIVARTGLADCRSHARAWTILARSTMPAVHVELGYLSHDADEAVLSDGAHLDALAEALVVSLQRISLGDDDTAATGVLRLGDLRKQLQERQHGLRASS